MGYLSQQPEFDPKLNVLKCAADGNPRLYQVRKELSQVESSLGDPVVFGSQKALSRALEKQQSLLEEYQQSGGDQYEDQVKEYMLSLGLSVYDFSKEMGELSGGQRKLIGLVRLLLVKPRILLLDEPDNHLDLEGKAFLEKMILNYPGTVVIISHDRYLLDRIASHIVELEDGKLTTFEGNYQTTCWINKPGWHARTNYILSSSERSPGSKQPSSVIPFGLKCIQKSEKFAKRAKSIQHRLDKMEKIEKPVIDRKRMNLKLNGWKGSNKVVQLIGLKEL